MRYLAVILSSVLATQSFASDCLSSKLACYPARDVCNAVTSEKGLASVIDPVLEDELVDSGWLERWERSVYLDTRQETDRLLPIVDEHARLEKELAAIGIDIQKLERQTRSRWFYFFSFSWLGSGVAEKKAIQLGEKQVEELSIKNKVAAMKKDVARYQELNASLPGLRESNGNYIRPTEKGTEWLKKLSEFSKKDVSWSVQQALNTYTIIEDILGRYDSLRKNSLYSSNHAPTLTLASLFYQKTPKEVVAIYNEARTSNMLYSSDHAPSLVMTSLQANRPIAEVLKVYDAIRKSEGLYSSDQAPALVSQHYRYQKSVEELMQVYRSMNSSKLYSNQHKPALMGLAFSSGKPINEVMDLYQSIRKDYATQLYSSDHVPGLMQPILNGGQSTQAVMDTYKALRALSLYSSNHAVPLTLTVLSTKKTIAEVNLVYQAFRNRSLYSSEHAPALTSAAVGISAAAGTSVLDMAAAAQAAADDSSSSSSSSGGGFDISMAIMGDLMDNGQLDLSAGFTMGGIMGGLD